jgi:hypothetical protein
MATRNGALLASPSNIPQITDFLSEKPLCLAQNSAQVFLRLHAV